MYEVFINNKKLVFAHAAPDSESEPPFKIIVSADDEDNRSEILEFLSVKKSKINVIIISDDPVKTRDSFFRPFKKIEAAGGIVKNNENKFLYIFRNNKWDIAKGKLEKNEKPESAAIRETEEETGIKELKLLGHFKNTHHIYYLNNQAVLKKTYWYLMHTDFKGSFSPQINEGITEVKWLDKEEILKLENTYLMIESLMKSYFNSYN